MRDVRNTAEAAEKSDGRWWYNAAFASARSRVCSPDDVNARSARAFITVRYLIRASRYRDAMLVADQPAVAAAAAFTREPLACTPRGSLIA